MANAANVAVFWAERWRGVLRHVPQRTVQRTPLIFSSTVRQLLKHATRFIGGVSVILLVYTCRSSTVCGRVALSRGSRSRPAPISRASVTSSVQGAGKRLEGCSHTPHSSEGRRAPWPHTHSLLLLVVPAPNPGVPDFEGVAMARHPPPQGEFCCKRRAG